MKTENDFRFDPGQGILSPTAVLEALGRAGYSNTRARRAVVYAICESAGHATPGDLLDRARHYHSGLGQVTVYRTLEILQGLGLVRKLHLEEGCHAYAPATHDHGHHVICQHCHRTVEFLGCDIEAAMVAVEQQTGFRVSNHWLEVFGVCPDCQAGAGPDGLGFAYPGQAGHR